VRATITRSPFFMLFVLMLLPAPGLGAEGDDSLSYSGASTISISILYEGAIKGFKQKTGFDFDSVDTLSGTGKGLAKLLEGKVTLCGSGRQLTGREKEAGLVGHVIAYDALALWVSRDNPVRNLSRDQAKGIFTGRILNWKQVGGPDRAIVLILEPAGEGRASMEILQATLLDNLPVIEPTRVIASHRDQIMEVSRNPDAICVASQGLQSSFGEAIASRVRFLPIDGVAPDRKSIAAHTYPLYRPLLLATRGAPSGKVKAFIDFMLSPEGQGVVARNFVRVR
jgi:phosphate transport system substrate-binding protein